MAEKPSNKSILEQLKNGIAQFELTIPAVSSISGVPNPPFFARIGPQLGGRSPAMRKVERYSIQKITGDGRCMFRALVKGMAFNKGIPLNPREERNDADDLRMAVREILCENGNERDQYEEALIAITVDESLKRYCERIRRPDFWGGESELLVLSKLCRQPVIVYIPEHEHSTRGRGSGFIPIAEYGAEFQKASRKGKGRKVVRLLYSGRNHYDLLV
ncbi:OTU domain [Dillenia turbinata]|uniref:Ubiquitin thioesterase OTU n=1 Tax=Dillenia turbinata TaxID=194707 RepID=A0AAN8W8C5_9MAGN